MAVIPGGEYLDVIESADLLPFNLTKVMNFDIGERLITINFQLRKVTDGDTSISLNSSEAVDPYSASVGERIWRDEYDVALISAATLCYRDMQNKLHAFEAEVPDDTVSSFLCGLSLLRHAVRCCVYPCCVEAGDYLRHMNWRLPIRYCQWCGQSREELRLEALKEETGRFDALAQRI